MFMLQSIWKFVIWLLYLPFTQFIHPFLLYSFCKVFLSGCLLVSLSVYHSISVSLSIIYQPIALSIILTLSVSLFIIYQPISLSIILSLSLSLSLCLSTYLSVSISINLSLSFNVYNHLVHLCSCSSPHCPIVETFSQFLWPPKFEFPKNFLKLYSFLFRYVKWD